MQPPDIGKKPDRREYRLRASICVNYTTETDARSEVHIEATLVGGTGQGQEGPLVGVGVVLCLDLSAGSLYVFI